VRSPDHPSRTLPLERVIALALDKHHLDPRSHGVDVPAIIDDLLGLHATVPTSPDLQLRARMPSFARTQLDELLDGGRAARVSCMRRTLFIESARTVPLVLAATRELRLRDRDRFLAVSGWTPRRYQRMAARVAAALAGRALDARQLRDAVGAAEPLSPVLIVMCDEGRLVRWSGANGWRSSRPRYRRFDEALPDVRLEAWAEDAAVRELVDRYIRRYGPVTEADVAWWTGLRRPAVRAAIDSLDDLVRVRVEGLRGVFLLHGADVPPAERTGASPRPTMSLLPVLDPYLQSHHERTRFVASRHRRFVIDSSGNMTSVILLDGRLAGVCDLVAHPAELRLCFFDAVETATRRGVHSLAIDVAAFVTGDAVPVVKVDRMTPLTDRSAGRFRSPLGEDRAAERPWRPLSQAPGSRSSRR
jgi:hypothetical protein